MDLSIKNQKDVINISTTYDGNFLASLANKGYRKETSLIKKQNGKLLPKEYKYTDDNETYEIIFNDNTAKLSSEHFEDQHIKSRNKIYDPISMLIILRYEKLTLNICIFVNCSAIYLLFYGIN